MNKDKHYILHLHGLVTLFFICVGSIIIWSNTSFYSYSYFYAWMYFLLSSWSIFSYWVLTERIFDLYSVMLLSVLVFLGGEFYLKLFFPYTPTVLKGPSIFLTYSNNILNTMTAYIFWGVSLLHLGGLVGVVFSKSINVTKCKPIRHFFLNRSLKIVGWGFIFISIIPQSLILIRNVEVVMHGSYGALTRMPAHMGYGSLARILSTFLIPGTIFVLSGSRSKSVKQVPLPYIPNSRLRPKIIKVLNIFFPLLLILFYSSVKFFAGDRSNAVMPLLMTIIVWDRKIYHISKWKLVILGIIILFLILPLVQVVRYTPGQLRFSFSHYVESYKEIPNPVFLILDTLGVSMRHLPHTLYLVPSRAPFLFGESYVRGFTTIFPNLFWETHPGSDFLGKGTPLGNQFELPEGRGLGFNLLAEAYRNFGILGIIIIPMLFGFSIGKITAWGEKTNPAKLAMMASFGAFILQIPRGYIGSAIRPFVWYALIPYLLVILIANKLMAKLIKSR